MIGLENQFSQFYPIKLIRFHANLARSIKKKRKKRRKDNKIKTCVAASYVRRNHMTGTYLSFDKDNG